MFSYVFYESMIQFPKVLTSTEISKRLRISYNAASLLKRRLQLFASQQLPKYKQLTYDALDREFKGFTLPPDENTDITHLMENRPYVSADTMVLFSASERANDGRKRYRHGGSTASIYLSDSLGGRQVGTLVHTIGVKKGPVFFNSVPSQKANTLGPIIKDHLPLHTPLMTDEGYPWLWGIYSNHRSVNHSARSKDIRYRWAKDRWSRCGVSNAVSEGNQRLLKTAFASYYYIRPENSTRYLNEFSFLKNAQIFGLDVLVGGDGSNCWKWNFFSDESGKPKAVGIRGNKYQLKRSGIKTENWLSTSIDSYSYIIQKEESEFNSRNRNDYVLLNESSNFNEFGPSIKKEMDLHNQFWSSPRVPNFQRKKEQEYQKTASKMWRLIHSKQAETKYHSISEVCSILNIHKQTAMLIIRKWLKLKLIEKRRLHKTWYDQRIDFFLKPKKENLPLILYTRFQKVNFKNLAGCSK
ncbi:ISXO2-like transposase domain protein [Leptospira alexanderi serovar Manhao 3 str. L 60]|uniref:ISXO2-like transposase domain protein n=1 Tax=Leptospira alexanderi serovar Manhao 3 str. L 60 TaxID=1049759 RepID=V6I907_9LEPT|nr:ISXO2-like transposase domain protein [Leptospira alexanderi serovar Manhao 3 str. L 60]